MKRSKFSFLIFLVPFYLVLAALLALFNPRFWWDFFDNPHLPAHAGDVPIEPQQLLFALLWFGAVAWIFLSGLVALVFLYNELLKSKRDEK